MSSSAPLPPAHRLLVVNHYFDTHGGGVEMVAGRLCIELSRLGFEVVWMASDCDGPPQERAGLRHLPVPAWNGIEQKSGVPMPIWGPRAILALWRQTDLADAVMVHDSLYLPTLAAMLFSYLRGKPYLLVQHIGEVPYRSRLLRLLVAFGNRVFARLAMTGARKIVFISDTVRNYFGAAVPAVRARGVFLPNGVDTELFRPVGADERRNLRARLGLPAEDPVMLFVGRFVEKKGLALLRLLAAARPQWVWLFIGSGPLDPTAWALPQVRALGRVDQADLPDWYRAADLLVLPSVGEGFPLVVQEAMACGTPALVSAETAAALPETREQLLSVPLGGNDDLDLCNARIDAWFASPPEMKQRTREAVAEHALTHWSWRTCAAQYREMIAGIIAQ